MTRRSREAARQLEMANGLAGIFVEREFQPHALRIVMAAAKAVVFAGFGLTLNCVTVGEFAVYHGEECDFNIYRTSSTPLALTYPCFSIFCVASSSC
jgi:hypothetical protein